MSIRCMSKVWEWSKSSGNSRLVLLALADNANDEDEAFPGILRIAKKCLLSESTIKRCLKELELIGELRIFTGLGLKTEKGFTNLYKITIRNNGVQIDPPKHSGGSDGGSNSRNGGSVVNPKPSVLEPSLIERSGERQSAKASSSKFQKPSKEELQAYCKDQGIENQTDNIFDHYEMVGWKVGGKSMKDWKAAVRLWKRRQAEFDLKPNKTAYKSTSAQKTVSLKDLKTSMEQAIRIASLMSNGVDEVHQERLPVYRPMIDRAVQEHGKEKIKALFGCVSPDRVNWLFKEKGKE